MPSPIFGTRGKGPVLHTGRKVGAARNVGAKVLTAPRSAGYLAAIGKLDASATLRPVELAKVIEEIHREFADRWAAVPIGFVGHCYLGPPFEAHTLTVDCQVIEHYQRGQPLPEQLEQARSLARAEQYLMIEVYQDRLVCVLTDGSVVTVGG